MFANIMNFAQSYSYNTTLSDSEAKGLGVVLLLLLVLGLATLILTLAGLWKLFVKAGKPGWTALVPIYNLYIWLQIVGRPTWWMLLFLLVLLPVVGPIASIALTVIICHDLSKSFGKSVGMTILLAVVPFVGFPILGFGEAKYQGPSALGNNNNHPSNPEPPQRDNGLPPKDF